MPPCDHSCSFVLRDGDAPGVAEQVRTVTAGAPPVAVRIPDEEQLRPPSSFLQLPSAGDKMAAIRVPLPGLRWC